MFSIIQINDRKEQKFYIGFKFHWRISSFVSKKINFNEHWYKVNEVISWYNENAKKNQKQLEPYWFYFCLKRQYTKYLSFCPKQHFVPFLNIVPKFLFSVTLHYKQSKFFNLTPLHIGFNILKFIPTYWL